MSQDNADGAIEGLVVSNQGIEHNPLSPLQKDAPINGPENEDNSWQGTVLDNRDPIEAAMSDLIWVYRNRRSGMTIEGDPLATFAHAARMMDIPLFGAPEALLHLLQQEIANINAMRRSGTLYDPNNQDVLGSHLELALDATLLYAWIKRYMQGYR